MIYDHIKNIGLYKGLSPALDLALEYIETVTPDVEVGSHQLDLGVKAVVSEGTTSLVNPKGYEAHRKYADVQLALVGTELIRCKPLPQSSARNSSAASHSRRWRRPSRTMRPMMPPATPTAPAPT